MPYPDGPAGTGDLLQQLEDDVGDLDPVLVLRETEPQWLEAFMSIPELYLHIGLSKTGTTYLQQALWESREALRQAGVLYPGDHPASQRQAVWDLLGRRLRGVKQPQLDGAWRRLAKDVTSWPGHKVIISEEFLVHARPHHLRRIHREFRRYTLHVVVTVRDLERTIQSMWQQELVIGQAWSLPEYVAAVRDPEAGPTTAAVRFWLRFDLSRILTTWQRLVPADHIHVVIVPPSGAPPEVLPTRFAEAVNLGAQVLQLPEEPANTSMGTVEAELLRRLNPYLSGRLNQRSRHYLIERVIRPSLKVSARLRLPDTDLGWIRKRAADQADMLSESAYHVVGDTADLVPPDRDLKEQAAEPVHEADVAACALTALQAVMVDYARYRTKRTGKVVSNASAVTKLTSAARALAFGTKFSVLGAADRNRVASRAAILYLRRLSTPR
jgi:hypothetical protein